MTDIFDNIIDIKDYNLSNYNDNYIYDFKLSYDIIYDIDYYDLYNINTFNLKPSNDIINFIKKEYIHKLEDNKLEDNKLEDNKLEDNKLEDNINKLNNAILEENIYNENKKKRKYNKKVKIENKKIKFGNNKKIYKIEDVDKLDEKRKKKIIRDRKYKESHNYKKCIKISVDMIYNNFEYNDIEIKYKKLEYNGNKYIDIRSILSYASKNNYYKEYNKVSNKYKIMNIIAKKKKNSEELTIEHNRSYICFDKEGLIKLIEKKLKKRSYEMMTEFINQYNIKVKKEDYIEYFEYILTIIDKLYE